MEPQTREKLRRWSNELDKLDDETKVREAEAWCLSALSILMDDQGFQEYIEMERKQARTIDEKHKQNEK